MEIAYRNNKKLAYSTWDVSELRRKREYVGVTQAKMAEILGISARMYRYYESGRTPISKPMEYAMEYLVYKSQISHGTRKEMEDLSEFEYERMVKLRDAIEKALGEEYFKNFLTSQESYIKRILTQTLKEFDIVLSKAKK
jgi:transcriptional regulator with XRE-family HTH domain